MAKKFSQREAQRLKKRVEELEEIISAQRKSWSSEWPSSVQLLSLTIGESTQFVVNTARRLGHGVVVTTDGNNLIFWGVRV